MENNKSISCRQAREIDMVNYLDHIGLRAKKIRGKNFWYCSPFRDERTASFKIDRTINRWYDFGEGKGGNLVDFAIRYHNCSIAEFLRSLSKGESLPAHLPTANSSDHHGSIRMEQVCTLHAPGLISYLKQRSITLEIASGFCQQVHYQLSGKSYFAIGFKNDLGGYELRNAFFKGSSSPKTITSFQTGSVKVCVFEGFMDFLSFVSLYRQHKSLHGKDLDFIILNSLSFLEPAMPMLLGYDSIHLYLDRDAAGRKACLNALQLSEKFHDESNRYAAFKDLNDFHCRLQMIPEKLKSEQRKLKQTDNPPPK